jgi:ribosome recycling factor
MNISEYKGDFEKEISFLKDELSKIRTGRATQTLLDSVIVEAYGTKTPLPQMANVTIPEPRALVIQPWDKTVLKDVEKALTVSDLGLSVKNDGDVLRATLPILTEESRKRLVKVLGEKMEKTRIALRQTRDHIKDDIKGMVSSKELTEDDKYKLLEELDLEIKSYNKKIEEMGKEKEEEIMKV